MTMRALTGGLAGLAGLCILLAAPGQAQTSSIEGDVKGPEGQLLRDAIVKIERLDIKGTYKTKSDRRGHYFHAGLPLGNYKITVEVDGKDVDTVNNVRTRLGDPLVVNFDLQALKQKQAALQRAADSGTLTQEQQRELSPEQRQQMEKQLKERQAAMSKNKALNDAFNEGMTALQAKAWDQAVDAFSKASEMDPKQHVVWANLAESFLGLAASKPATEQQPIMEKGLLAFTKALELKPEEAAYFNNYGLALARARKVPEAEAALTKAAQLDPTKAGTYFFNLGAVLVNTGQVEQAGTAFKKAIDADPNHADAFFQYGIYLISKATVTPEGKVMPLPGTKEAFEKYLQLKPTGGNADSAKGMIATIEASLVTTYENPEAQKKKKKK